MATKKIIVELHVETEAPVERVVEVIGRNLEFGTSKAAFEDALASSLGEAQIVDFKVIPKGS